MSKQYKYEEHYTLFCDTLAKAKGAMKLNQWEKDFMQNMTTMHAHCGIHVILTDSQWRIFNKIAEKLRGQ